MPQTKNLIVGGGVTADAAAEGIRQIDPNGSIGLISAEPHRPSLRRCRAHEQRKAPFS